MRVDVELLIHMGRHQHLISFAPQLLGQLNANAVRLFRCDLALPKRLIAVISDCPVFLAEPLFTAIISLRAVPAVQFTPVTSCL